MIKNNHLPDGFVYISEFINNIDEAILYATDDNFLGSIVNGYLAPKAILSRQATTALVGVQHAANTQSLSLKIFDAYRPQQAVKHFLRWIGEEESPTLKQRFHPEFSKAQLFEEGYLASQSAHSRGSTIDLTLISQETGKEVDMGTEFDFFGEASWTSYQKLSSKQKANRHYLQEIMSASGFQPFELEWWHFTLVNEPFPDTFFDFLVR